MTLGWPSTTWTPRTTALRSQTWASGAREGAIDIEPTSHPQPRPTLAEPTSHPQPQPDPHSKPTSNPQPEPQLPSLEADLTPSVGAQPTAALTPDGRDSMVNNGSPQRPSPTTRRTRKQACGNTLRTACSRSRSVGTSLDVPPGGHFHSGAAYERTDAAPAGLHELPRAVP